MYSLQATSLPLCYWFCNVIANSGLRIANCNNCGNRQTIWLILYRWLKREVRAMYRWLERDTHIGLRPAKRGRSKWKSHNQRGNQFRRYCGASSLVRHTSLHCNSVKCCRLKVIPIWLILSCWLKKEVRAMYRWLERDTERQIDRQKVV